MSNPLLALLNFGPPREQQSQPSTPNAASQSPLIPSPATQPPSSSTPHRLAFPASVGLPASPPTSTQQSQNLLASLLAAPAPPPAASPTTQSDSPNVARTASISNLMGLPVTSPTPPAQATPKSGATDLLSLLTASRSTAPQPEPSVSPPAPPPQSQATPQPASAQPSMFDFVSPFDILSQPAPSSSASASQPALAPAPAAPSVALTGASEPLAAKEAKPAAQPVASPPPAAAQAAQGLDSLLQLLSGNKSAAAAKPQAPVQAARAPATISSKGKGPAEAAKQPEQRSSTPVAPKSDPTTGPPTPKAPAALQPPSPAKAARKLLPSAADHLRELHETQWKHDGPQAPRQVVRGHQRYTTLDLAAPQPCGKGTLHPAKTEVLPVARLSANANFPTARFPDAESGESFEWAQHKVLFLDDVAVYCLNKGRVRLLCTKTGARGMIQLEDLKDAKLRVSSLRRISTPGDLAVAVAGDYRIAVTFADGKGAALYDLAKDEGEIKAMLVKRVQGDVVDIWPCASGSSSGQVGDDVLIFERAGIKLASGAAGSSGWEWGNDLLLNANARAAAVSRDGKTLATLASAAGNPRKLLLQVTPTSKAGPVHTRELKIPAEFGNLVDPLAAMSLHFISSGSLLIGFQRSTCLGVFQIERGRWTELIAFEGGAPDVSSFNLVHVDTERDSLLIANSARASVITLALSDIECRHDMHEGKPIRFQEVALANAPTSWDVAAPNGTGRSALSMFAEGIEVVHLPRLEEAAVLAESSDVAEPEEQPAESKPTAAEKGKAKAVEPKTANEVVEPLLAAQGAQIDETKAKAIGTVPDSSAPAAQPEPPARKETAAIEEASSASQPANGVHAGVPPAQPGQAPATILPPSSPSKVPGTPAVNGKKANQKKTQAKAKAPSQKAKTLAVEDNEAATSEYESEAGAAVSRAAAGPGSSEALQGLEARLMAEIRKGAAQPAAAAPVKSSLTKEDVQQVVESLLPTISQQVRESASEQVASGLSQAMTQTLPAELHKLMLRPDVVSHLSRGITSSVLPPVQKTAMEVVSSALAPHFEDVIGGLTDKVEKAIHVELLDIRKSIVMEQGQALLQSEGSLRDLVKDVGNLTAVIESQARTISRLEQSLAELKKSTAASAAASPAPAGAPTSTNATTQESRMREVWSADGGVRQSPRQPYDGGGRGTVTPIGRPSNAGSTSQQLRMTPTSSSAGPNIWSSPAQAGLPTGPSQQQPQQLASPAKVAVAPAPVPAAAPAASVDVEDVLLGALTDPNIEQDAMPLGRALLRLHSHFGSIDAAVGGNKVSQPVMLAAFHRLTMCLAAAATRPGGGGSQGGGLPPQLILPWLDPLARSIDPNDATIAAALQQVGGTMRDNLTKGFANPAAHVGAGGEAEAMQRAGSVFWALYQPAR